VISITFFADFYFFGSISITKGAIGEDRALVKGRKMIYTRTAITD
jgi:hypothetical protein